MENKDTEKVQSEELTSAGDQENSGSFDSWEFVLQKLATQGSNIDRVPEAVDQPSVNTKIYDNDVLQSWVNVSLNLENSSSKNFVHVPETHMTTSESLADNSYVHKVQSEHFRNSAEQPSKRNIENDNLSLKQTFSQSEIASSIPDNIQLPKENQTNTSLNLKQTFSQSETTPLVPNNIQQPLKKIQDVQMSLKETSTQNEAIPSVTNSIEQPLVENEGDLKQTLSQNESAPLVPSNIPQSRTQNQGNTSLILKQTSKQNDTAPSIPSNIPTRDELPSLDLWECTMCTFLNVPSDNICEMCNNSKMRGPELSSLPSGKICPMCTFINDARADSCNICEATLQSIDIS